MLKLLSFYKILEQATAHITSLSESRQQEFKERLKQGKALLENNDELKAYCLVLQKALKSFSIMVRSASE